MSNSRPASYAGFTIGPIIEVLSHSQKTRELWFGSYFFSWYMEKLIEIIIGQVKNKTITFLTPYVDTQNFQSSQSTVGYYHDRFILHSTLEPSALFQLLKNAEDVCLNYFVDLIDTEICCVHHKNKINNVSSKKILTHYLQRNFLVLKADQVDKLKPVKCIDQYLNSMEENRTFELGEMKNSCDKCKTLPAVTRPRIHIKENNQELPKEQNLCPLCFIKYYCYRHKKILKKINLRDTFYFPSIPDIAARDLYINADIMPAIEELNEYRRSENWENLELDFEDLEQIVKDVNSRKTADKQYKIKNYHKYCAIIQGDGDNVGGLAADIDDPEELSRRLFAFTRKAEQIIKSYQGKCVYIGGDDFLAFLPVAFHKDNCLQTVLDCAVELSQLYKDIVNEQISDDNAKSTLSIGVNIAYYKYPLSYALKNAREQLFVKAKGQTHKNSLALRLTKHSGKSLELLFAFDSDELNSFKNLLQKVLASKVDFPHGVHYNLGRFKTLLKKIPDKERLSYFFDNNFNEAEHSSMKNGLDQLKDFFAVMVFQPSVNKDKAILEFLQAIKFIKFLRGDKE